MLPDAAWDRHEGVHEVDFGVEFDLDGEVWGLIWGSSRTTHLECVRGGLAGEVRDSHRLDVSGRPPWSDVVGLPLPDFQFENACVLRIDPRDRGPIWIATANLVEGNNPEILLCGDSVLVIHDLGVARANRLA